MKKTMICSMAAMMLAVTVFLTACGEKTPSVDTTPFEKSITEYLAKKNMEMKVSSFKDIKVNGDQATATCSLKHSAGLGPAVQWGFTFKKEGDTWIVSAHKQ